MFNRIVKSGIFLILFIFIGMQFFGCSDESKDEEGCTVEFDDSNIITARYSTMFFPYNCADFKKDYWGVDNVTAFDNVTEFINTWDMLQEGEVFSIQDDNSCLAEIGACDTSHRCKNNFKSYIGVPYTPSHQDSNLSNPTWYGYMVPYEEGMYGAPMDVCEDPGFIGGVNQMGPWTDYSDYGE